MEKEGEIYCDRCGQPVPKVAKLAAQPDGTHICLACQIRESQMKKRSE
ncbi:MAG: hypothetical protein ABL995_08520 [Bryobacteraceae bacterium]